MKRFVIMMSVVLAVASVVWAAPLRPADVSKDANIMLHLDIEQLKSTEVGQRILQELNTGERGAKITAFALKMGFDPRKDISSLTVYGKSGQSGEAVLLLRGAFDAPRMIALAQANKGYEAIADGTLTIHSWVENVPYREVRRYGAVHGSGVFLVSEGREMLQTALDVLDGRLPGLDAETAQSFQSKEIAPFFVASGAVNKIPQKFGNSPVMNHIIHLQLMLGEQAGSVVGCAIAKTQNAEASETLADIVAGLIALAKINKEANPVAAEVAEATQFSMQGDSVLLKFQVPTALGIKLVEQKIAYDKARREARRKAAAAQGAQADSPK